MTVRTSINAGALRKQYNALERVARPDVDNDICSPSTQALDAVNEAWEAVASAFKARGFKASNDDAAEELVGILWGYLRDSNPEPLARTLRLMDHEILNS